MPDQRRLVVLVNASARRSAREDWRAAVALLETGASVSVAIPPTPEAMDASVRSAVASGVDGIVVVGGDGTVNRVVNALAGSPTPLGVVPLGTGNDFARALALPPDPVAAARRVLDGHAVPLDLVDVNGRRFCTAGLLGIPAAAALTVRRWFSPGARTRPMIHVLGGAAYTMAGARHLLAPVLAADTYRIAWSGGSLSTRAHGVFVANTTVLGGGLVIPVGSDSADGQAEIVLIREGSRMRLLYAFVCFARGWRLPAGVLETVRTDEVTIECDGLRPFAADGDLMCEDARFHVAVKPGALRVFV